MARHGDSDDESYLSSTTSGSSSFLSDSEGSGDERGSRAHEAVARAHVAPRARGPTGAPLALVQGSDQQKRYFSKSTSIESARALGAERRKRRTALLRSLKAGGIKLSDVLKMVTDKGSKSATLDE